MKRTLMMALCMATVSLYGLTGVEADKRIREGTLTFDEAAIIMNQELERIRRGVTPEEARQIVRYYKEDLTYLTHSSVMWMGVSFYKALGYDALPGLYEMFDETVEDWHPQDGVDGETPDEGTTDDWRFANGVACALYMIDGQNLVSTGERGALDRILKIVEMQKELSWHVELYLLKKGDADAFNFLEQRGYALPELGMRVQGTNVFKKPDKILRHGPNEYPAFFPSVTNMGPQAVYVYQILKHYWEQIGQDFSKIPDELLTMVVSFDADGNPVCNVDLAKYGLSMPIIEPFPASYAIWAEPTFAVTFPHETTNAPSTNATLNSPPAEGCPKGRSPEGGVVPVGCDDLGAPSDAPPPAVIARSAATKQSILIGIGILALAAIAFAVRRGRRTLR